MEIDLQVINDIIKNIDEFYAPLSKACVEDLLGKMSFCNYKKADILVKEGHFADQSYFIVSGCARAYYLHDGRDITDWFAFENDFISSIVSFFTGAPSPHYIEILEDAVVLQISKKSTELLAAKHHDFERLMREVVTKTMLSQRERISSILFHTAEERYEQILCIRPDITKRVALTHIASYLGMTLETLSRIRKPKNRI